MPPIKTILIPSGGMNQDDSILTPPPGTAGHSLFGQGDYRYARNARIGSTNSNHDGAIENIPSTLEVEYGYEWDGAAFVAASPPTGVNLPRGRYEDEVRGHVYVAIQNDGGDDLIYRYERSSGQIKAMLRWTGLNFAASNIIAMTMINQFLIITCKDEGADGDRNPPRIFDVNDDSDNAVYKLKFTLAAHFQEFHISFAKWAPLAAPVARRSITETSEFVEKGIFQFSYRYVYRGGFKSTFAPPSWFVTAEIGGLDFAFNLQIPGFLFRYNDRSNTSFQHDNVAFYEFVEFIELAYRESSIASWKIFSSHAVTSGGGDNKSFDFINNGPSSLIPSKEIAQPFDSVPFFSGAVEAIDNRPLLADNEDDLLPIEDFTISDIEIYSSTIIADNWNGPQSAFSSLSGAQQTALGQILNCRQFSFKEKGVYKLALVLQHFSGRTWLAQTTEDWTYILTSQGGATSSGVSTMYALGFKIPPSVIPPETAVAYQIVRSNCLNHEFFIYGEVNNIKYLSNDVNDLNDEIETPDTIQDDRKSYYDNFNPASGDQPLSARVLSSIRKSKEVSSVTNAAWIYFDIANWMLSSKADTGATSDNASNNIYYNFQKGDRLRFRGSEALIFPPITYTTFDEEIIEYTGKGVIVAKPPTLTFLYKRENFPSASTSQFRIEIFRPKSVNSDAEVLFYTMGEWYPITQPGTPSRDFAKRDFTWGGASAVTATEVNGHTIYNRMPITCGDVWIVTKPFYYDWVNASPMNGVSTLTKWIQMNQDKTQAAGVWDHNNGRPYVAYKYLTPVIDKPTQARFGQKYLQDSVYNSINTFYDPDQIIFPLEYGRIRALINTSNAQVESTGNILLVLGEETPWSVYVNRTTLEDLAGKTQVAISDKVLGSYNTLLGNYGCINPESWSRRDGRVIWWSQRNGTWARYSRDGVTPVSEYKMKTWFREVSDLIAPYYGTAEEPRLLSAFDNFHNEWLTSVDHSELPALLRGYTTYKRILFSENDKRWKTAINYEPQLLAALHNDVYELIGTSLHLLERGADYGTFQGTKYDTDWEPVCNTAPKNSKSWQALELIAQDTWSFPSIKGDEKSDGGTEQETRILLTSLQRIENRWVCKIPNDMNTPNAASTEEAIVNGRKMRSKALRIYMRLNPDVDYQTVLNYLGVTFIDSPKN